MKSTKTFHVRRNLYTAQATLGELYIDEQRICYTLEDTVRANGIKVKGHTAIPEGIYKMTSSFSNRFQREMIMLYTEPNKYELMRGGIQFKGIRVHGGNTHHNTEGCPLVAHNKINDSTIQGTAEKDGFALYEKYSKQGFECLWKVTNQLQQG